jgi:Rhs element Vgr protein
MKKTIQYTIRSDGEEIMQTDKLKSILILNEANRIPRAQLVFLDGEVSKQDFKLSNLDFFKPGRMVEIGLGYEGDVNPVFRGLIIKHGIRITDSNASYLEIECKHEAVRLTFNKKNQFFYDVSDGEALGQLLEETNLKYTINGLSEFTHSQLVQYECTTWDFMLSRADVNGHLLLFNNEELTIAAPSMEGKTQLDCHYGLNVISFHAEIGGEGQSSDIKSKTWSSAEQDLVVTNGKQDFTNQIGNIKSDDLARAVNGDSFLLQHSANLPEDELTTWANSRATKNELSMVRGNVRIRGISNVFPGDTIRLKGFGDRFTGKAYVTGVRHEVSNGNWTTSLQFGLTSAWHSQQKDFHALPAAGMLPAVKGLLIGVVTQLENDPEKEYRIKVRIPMISNEEEGIWAQLANGYAGDNYGTFFLPEIGDEVIVSFLNEDPRKPVILGMLHSSAKPSPIPLTDDNHQKAIISRSNIKIIWDDDKNSITISTPGGNQIKLDDEGGEIHISDAHQNSVKMDDQGITIHSGKDLILKANQNIDLEGMDISSKAHGRFSAEGGAGAEVKTNAIAVIKGSLVRIN